MNKSKICKCMCMNLLTYEIVPSCLLCMWKTYWSMWTGMLWQRDYFGLDSYELFHHFASVVTLSINNSHFNLLWNHWIILTKLEWNCPFQSFIWNWYRPTIMAVTTLGSFGTKVKSGFNINFALKTGYQVGKYRFLEPSCDGRLVISEL